MKANWIFFLVSHFFCTQAFSQIDNTPFYLQADSTKKSQYSLHLDYSGFLKNNEYFTKITDGYTIFGSHLIPTFQYSAHPNFSLMVGGLFWKNFGEDGFHQIEPVITARFHNKSNQLFIGTLDGSLSHNLIEPLYDFENQWLRRLENGFQWKHQSSKLKLDAWVDWRKMIFQNSNEQEKIVGGLSVWVPIFNLKNFKFEGIFQGTAFHKGGQIDTTKMPLTNWFNGTIGVSSTVNFESGKLFKQINFQGYLLGYKDRSNTIQIPFESGGGFYLNFLAKSKWLDVMATYWDGRNFTTFQGGKLYRSTSSNIKEPQYYEHARKIIIIRVLKDFKISQNIFIVARLEPYYDLNNKFWEFSHGLFFTYRGNLYQSKK